ncbi:ribonucleoprotein, chloroplast, putative [Entamoeba dispar SAW760]|uniref:Ribonucleoprotein, chloroplast, putative n=1 Tax=Entamoeba dispar (strain ATCC PRA-260 / SAW760) TaxID=370354 RepID=B0ER02_ENTDS|nr:ribonucleoprotein, chloroplast, putative [Entamoeba dispar SAW760]EDR23049.1 ribonucleoprotein, chloroplast, putative [Entamoeba dispar SAW760]|eukprot:EDR23049.1 ribonucleoprotein, chloroplast, putative [Entamoeba dispar SAW760]
MGDKTDQDDNEYTNLYIGNIPYSSTEKDVKNFIQCDECKITIVIDKNTGKTKGFGFVAFETHEQALEIKNKLQGKELEGRPIILKWDRGLQSKVSDKNYKFGYHKQQKSSSRRRGRSYSRHRSSHRREHSSRSRSDSYERRHHYHRHYHSSESPSSRSTSRDDRHHSHRYSDSRKSSSKRDESIREKSPEKNEEEHSF